MNASTSQFCVTILAGEASGDQHGAKLVSAMQKKYPALCEFYLSGFQAGNWS